MRFRPTLFSLLLALLAATSSIAAEPNAAQIMSDQTVVFLRIADTQDYVKKLDQTAIGRAASDPQMQPFVNGIWQTLKQSVADAEERSGISLEELLSIPQGELAIGVVAMQEGNPGVVILCELGEDTRVTEKVLDLLETVATNDGATIERNKFKNSEITLIRGKNGPLAVCIHEHTLLASNRIEALEDMLDHWDGKREDSLAADDRFRTIVSSSRGTKDEPAQMIWYLNPMETLRTIVKNQSGGGYIMAFMPVLGLDGVKAVGGSTILAAEDFDTISHFHVMLERPRTGIIEIIQMKNASTEPEAWVPDDITNYMTMNWDVDKSYNAVEKLYDNILGEDKFEEDIKNRINQPTGIDFKTEIIDNLEGKFTLVQWYEPPARINSQATLFAAKVKDRAAMQRTLDHLVDALPRLKNLVERRNFGDATFFQLQVANGPIPDDISDERRKRMETRRSLRPLPCFGLIGDFVFFADRPGIVEHIALTLGGDTPRLADDLSFKLTMNRLLEQAGERKVAMVSFSRPEEGLRMFYDLIQADSTRNFIKGQAEENNFFSNLEGNLNANPLPEFKVISKYLAPQGSIMIDDETGLHMIQFSLKRDSD
ncbi:hypothetical protein DTL42_04110 [Bremerella cremea]|uniref:DUF3352 domain-containing protein n=1 Tax=Bremerella cremea TaxID=1031537 RepID=A0A368KXG8_9BACT|nr:hypothetical protein [Bremerella cremea]RCS54337.1 hypothetical protein DTL42_04110 [Bremerella cremea]